MKVLIYSGANYSDNTLPLYKSMKEKGIDVTLLWELRHPNASLFDEGELLSDHGIIKGDKFKAINKYSVYAPLDNVYVENIPYYNPLSLKYLKKKIGLLKFIRDGKFDVIHTDLFYLGWQTLLYAFRNKTVLVVHEAIPHARKLKLYQKIFRNLSLKLISKRVVLNKTCKNDFIRLNHFDPKTVLANRLGPLDSISICSNNTNITVNPKKILFWGRIAEYKGIEYLCEAMPIVHESIPDAELTIAGGGDFYFNIEPYKNLPYIHIKNHYLSMQEMYDEICSSAFTVCPYKGSSQSGGILTSMALGIPVIASDFPTIREMVDDDITGVLFRPKDSKALADAIIKLLKDPNLQQKLKSNIQEKYGTGEYSWNTIVDKYLEFYKQ